MKTHPARKSQAFPLQLVLIIPFVLQIFAAVGLVGFFSFRNGQKAVNDLASQLMERTTSSVNQHLDSYLAVPHKVLQTNADAIQMGLLDVRDREKAGRYLWHQMKAYDLTYLGIGLITGAGVGAARYDGKTVTIDDWPTRPPNNVTNYATDAQGNRTEATASFDYDNFSESWYLEPLKAKKPIWSRIYTWNSPYGPYITATAGRPIYDQNNQLLGMIGADIHLLKLSNFLQDLQVSRSGQVFIMERNGLLIANAGEAKPFSLVQDEVQRLQAVESSNPVLQGIAEQLQRRFGNFQNITQAQELQFSLEREPYYVHVTPWRDEYGLDWLVVVSVPQKDFMAQINANTRSTVLLCLIALGVAVILGIFTSRWIAYPILRLNQASAAMAAGDLDQRVADSKIQELNLVASSFNHMASQLSESFNALEKSNAELEDRVEARTTELKNTLSELQRTQAQVIQGEKMSSLGQLVAGVAHEINNPVNFIHGNLIHVQEYTQDLLGVVQLYQQHYPDPVPEIADEAEEIDLEFMQQDLPKVLSSMKMGTDRIRQIVLSLRNFSRMDEAEIKAVNIHEGLDSTLLILQHRLKARPEHAEIQVVRDYGTLPLVECYAGQMNQVFMNILTNAIDALEENFKPKEDAARETPATITVRTSVVDAQWAQIAIADNGPGIPAHIQQRIFNPFFTTKPVGKGTGMGMSISYQIITEKHGGKLECHSNPGEGTEFVIQIPLQTQAFTAT